jgi:hypothetical protein
VLLMNHEQWMKLLRRYLARFYELATNEEEMGAKRARSDGQLTMLLEEIALRLPPDEQELVQEMIAVHNALWQPSQAEMLRVMRRPAGS